MQKISLNSVVLSVFFLVAVYFAITMSHSSREIEATTKIVLNGSGEIDSLARLDTYAKSGTNWGMSPFGSGASLVNEVRPIFKKPNLEWGSKTLSGITYVFGAGNPKEVVKKKEDYADEFDFFHDAVVTVQTEKNLVTLLSNPMLTSVFSKCDVFISGDLLTDGRLDMERILFIDSTTGRKKLDEHGLAVVGTELSSLQVLNSTGARTVAEQCLNQDEIRNLNVLIAQYNAVFESYTNGNMMYQ
jgi:hypothetical protein